MSDVRPEIDLSTFSRPLPPPPRRSPWRVVVPTALLLGFAAVFASVAFEAWRPAIEVVVVRAEPGDHVADDAAAPDLVVLQAAGWVEPDPFPVHAAALTPGVVREVFVRESDDVGAGDPVARLDDAAASLEVARTAAESRRAAAERDRAAAEARAAEESFALALAAREAARAAEAAREGRVAESRARASVRDAGDARVTVARAEAAVQEALVAAGSAPPQAAARARAALEEARAAAAGLAADAARATAEAEVAAARAERAAAELRTRTEDRLRRDATAAALRAAEAAAAAADAEAAAAALVLDRMTIRAPRAGRVLDRLVAPGSALTPEAPTAVLLYDPSSLRVRVDVAQADAAKVVRGQAVRIAADAAGREYRGTVTRIVSRADVQKVALQVHVRVLDPDDGLRPDQLCQARFAPPPAAESRRDGDGAKAARTASVRLPRRLVVDGAVWTLDPVSRRARRTPVVLGPSAGEFVEILSGVDLSAKILDPGAAVLTDGAPVRLRER